MKAMYSTEISIKEARAFMCVYFGTPRIPNGSRVLWVAGCKWVTDQPGAYLIGGTGGMQGIIVIQPAVAQAEEVAG